jgi:hypothetical protein
VRGGNDNILHALLQEPSHPSHQRYKYSPIYLFNQPPIQRTIQLSSSFCRSRPSPSLGRFLIAAERAPYPAAIDYRDRRHVVALLLEEKPRVAARSSTGSSPSASIDVGAWQVNVCRRCSASSAETRKERREFRQTASLRLSGSGLPARFLG